MNIYSSDLSQGKRPFIVVPNINMRFNIPFFYIIVNVIIELPGTSAFYSWINKKENSTCEVYVVETKTRFVPYLETFTRFAGLFPSQRINYKVEYVRSGHYEDKCCQGYKQISNRCIPICSPDCKNGKCEAPDVCTCFPGYERSTKENNVCTPICSNGCLNGDCIQPEVCNCSQNYWLDSDGYTCRPTCEKDCESRNGYCSIPNTCICQDGYRMSNETNICEPICEHECVNAKCVKPNVCSCESGHRHEEDNPFVCKAICQENCIFGTCTAPNVCTCNEGYESRGNGNFCKPICSQQCQMGTCIAPETCTCGDGYELSKISMYVCEPICEHACTNATCIAPNTCKCNEGFILSELDVAKATCKPFCNYSCGPNAQCTAPNHCTCQKGYRIVDRAETTNGVNVVSDSGNFTCVPDCENDCVNGTCVAPNTCQCNRNFVNTKIGDTSVCVPVCSRNCSGHGTCPNEFNDTCLCFFGWTGPDCEEANICVYKTTLDSTLLSSVTVINETNSTLMKSYDDAPLCYQCSDSLDNETLCLAVQSDESLTIPTVGCFFSTELPCYKGIQHDSLKRYSGVTESLIGITITIMMIVAVTAYVIIYKRRKRGTITVNTQASSLYTAGTEALIVDD